MPAAYKGQSTPGGDPARRGAAELERNGTALPLDQQELRELIDRIVFTQRAAGRRIVRELEDTFSRKLAVLEVETAAIERDIPVLPEPVRERLRGIASLIAELSAEVHRISGRIHPTIVDDSGLAAAVEAECLAFCRRHGVSVALHRGPVSVETGNDARDSSPAASAPLLTRRQREVIRLIAEGRTGKEMGSLLHISPRTVEFHKYRIMKVLGVETTASLIQYAIRNDL